MLSLLHCIDDGQFSADDDFPKELINENTCYRFGQNSVAEWQLGE